DENIEHVAASVLTRMRWMRWPIDQHQSDAGHRGAFVFHDEAKIASVFQTRPEPDPESGTHGPQDFLGPAWRIRCPKHFLAMPADQIEIVGCDRPCHCHGGQRYGVVFSAASISFTAPIAAASFSGSRERTTRLVFGFLSSSWNG